MSDAYDCVIKLPHVSSRNIAQFILNVGHWCGSQNISAPFVGFQESNVWTFTFEDERHATLFKLRFG